MHAAEKTAIAGPQVKPHTEIMTFAARLKSARVEKQMTQLELAKKCGVTQPTYSGWEVESDKAFMPAADKVLAAARALNVRFLWLVEGSGPVRGNVDALMDRTLKSTALKEALRISADRYVQIEQRFPKELLAVLQTPTLETLPEFERNLALLLERFSAGEAT